MVDLECERLPEPLAPVAAGDAAVLDTDFLPGTVKPFLVLA
ncbi:hypothetical protein ACFU67_32115 [Streptomyces rhizosphaericola]